MDKKFYGSFPRFILFFLLIIPSSIVFADDTTNNTTNNHPKIENASIASNPGAVNTTAGNGALEDFFLKKLNIENDHGIRFSGAWVADTNALFSGGIPDARKVTNNSLFLFDVTVDTQKMGAWDGGLFGAQFLQFNGSLTNTNAQAGSVQGYNSLPGAPPLNRSELYQLWYRQLFFSDMLSIRIGKVVPTFDFGNVIKPVPLNQDTLSIPAVSGLIFTPLFVNSSMLGVMPGYYNSAYGATVSLRPSKNWYASYGIYDGNMAQGVQTGLTGPNFNGNYFQIGETGFDWLAGKNEMPGNVGVGLWNQTGLIQSSGLSENNATGLYLFGSQRVWYREPGVNSSGLSLFYQFGENNSSVLPMKTYVGGGVTAFGLIPHRSDDSMGIGTALSWLNQTTFSQRDELMFQLYYQAHLIKGCFLEPVISYIPNPAGGVDLSSAWAGTLRAVLLF